MAKAKGGLGRNLLDMYATTSEELGMMQELSIKSIVPNPNQPRKDFDEDKIAELAASIKQKGLIEPIVVRPVKNGKYELIAGERRWQATKSLGLTTISAIVRKADDRESMELALIENLHRDDLNAIEEARGYKQLIDEYKLKQSEVAECVSKSRITITNTLRLLDLPEEVQQMVFDGELSAGHARAILGVAEDDKRIALAKKVVAEGRTVRDTENLVRLYAAGETERPKRAPSPRSFKIVAKNLRKSLGTDVRVTSTRGKNKIEITFSDEDDLQRLYELISGTGE